MKYLGNVRNGFLQTLDFIGSYEFRQSPNFLFVFRRVKMKVSRPPYELDSISKTIDDVGTDCGTSLICVRPSVCNELDVSAHSSPLSTSWVVAVLGYEDQWKRQVLSWTGASSSCVEISPPTMPGSLCSFAPLLSADLLLWSTILDYGGQLAEHS